MIFTAVQKYYFVLNWRFIFQSLPNDHIYNVASALPNVVKLEIKGGNGVLTFLFDIFYLTLFILTLKQRTQDGRCHTSRRCINLKATLKQRSNVCCLLQKYCMQTLELMLSHHWFLMLSGLYWTDLGHPNLGCPNFDKYFFSTKPKFLIFSQKKQPPESVSKNQ